MNPTLDSLSRDTPLQQTAGPDLPLNAAYYANDHQPNLRDVLTVGERPQTTPSAIRPEVASSYVDTFGTTTGSAPGWTAGANTAPPTISASAMSITSTGGTYGWVAKAVSAVDLDAFPILRISVLSAGAGWALKVNAHTTDDPAFPDTVIQSTTATAGVYTYDLKSLMGWSGTMPFRIRIFTSGASNTVKVDDIRMQTVATSTTPTTFDDEFNGTLNPAWVPSLPADASASGGALHLQVAGTTGTNYAYVNRALPAYNVDQYPYLQITVSSAAQQWTLKVTSGGTTVVLQDPSAALGTFTYNVPALTGWHGAQSVTLQIMSNGYQKPITVDDIQVSTPNAPAEAFRDDFGSSNNTSSCTLSSTGLDTGWTAVASTAPCVQTVGGLLHLSRNGSTYTYGSIQRQVTVDVTQNPTLFVSVPAVTGGWVLRVHQATGPVVVLQPLMLQAGRFTYDIPKQTGWSGTKTFTVQIDAGGYKRADGTSVSPAITFDYIGIRAAAASPWLGAATSTTNSWLPQQLSFTGGYADGMAVSGRDVFHDNNSVGRSMNVTGIPATKDLQLSGLYRGTPVYNSTTRVMTVTMADLRYSLALPAATTIVIRYYPDKDSMLRGGPALLAPGGSSGYWTATFSGLASATVNVGVGFAVTSDATGTETSRAQAADTTSAVANDPSLQAAFWDAFLQRVPKPVNFDVQGGLPANGVTPTQTRALYYRAWIFLQSQVIEPESEIGQSYPQMAAGKASLYRSPVPGASAMSTWDVDTALQLLVYIDPASAWGALQEIVSKIPSDGAWQGEPLPAREMQTAWILYMVTGDTAQLNQVYLALKNLLTFKVGHLAYIAPTGTGSTTCKEANFASAALVDLGYAQKVAAVVGDTTTNWAGTQSTLLTQSESWFWATSSTQPVQLYNCPNQPLRASGAVMSTTPMLDAPGLDATRMASTYARFQSLYDPTKPFAGFGDGGATDAVENDVRYGIVDETTYGLLKDGKSTDAQVLANAIMRDTVIADSLSERYQWSSTVAPHGEGNTPTVFGAAELIWAVWLNNGYRLDDGTPSFVSLSGAEGGIDNLSFHGYVLNEAVNAPAAQVTLTGSIVTTGGSCGTLSVPVGSTVPLSAVCSNAY
ncbi:MAG: hypothetical protein ACR2KJ_16325 [Jatrophihabitans sp.]